MDAIYHVFEVILTIGIILLGSLEISDINIYVSVTIISVVSLLWLLAFFFHLNYYSKNLTEIYPVWVQNSSSKGFAIFIESFKAVIMLGILLWSSIWLKKMYWCRTVNLQAIDIFLIIPVLGLILSTIANIQLVYQENTGLFIPSIITGSFQCLYAILQTLGCIFVGPWTENFHAINVVVHGILVFYGMNQEAIHVLGHHTSHSEFWQDMLSSTLWMAIEFHATCVKFHLEFLVKIRQQDQVSIYRDYIQV